MVQRFKRKCKPTTVLLVTGFVISFTAVLMGISSANSILIALSDTEQPLPVYDLMKQTGLSLSISIYIFSIANCLVVTNYWIITQRRDMAIRKAFGWTNARLIGSVITEMGGLILFSLCISTVFLSLLRIWKKYLFSVQITPFFVFGTIALLLLTLLISAIIPFKRILKIHPAEVIS